MPCFRPNHRHDAWAGVRAVLDAYCAQDRLRTAEAQMCYVLEPMRQQVSGLGWRRYTKCVEYLKGVTQRSEGA